MLQGFAILIISHGRPNEAITEEKLRGGGYTGRIIYVLDELDSTLEDYYKKHDYNDIYVFSKMFEARHSDRMDNFQEMRATLFARNICWQVARELGLESFCVMDDDYYYFGHRGPQGAKKTLHLDDIFEWFVDYLKATPIKCLAFSQGGDHIGGYNEDVVCKRKMMNSFICLTSRPFKFYGMMNDDVNAYLRNGMVGDIYLTYMAMQLDQVDTQQGGGGLTEAYQAAGTYRKSFYSVMIAPSCVSIKLMGEKSPRLHHSINWVASVPMIISETYKKH